jgi:hypothetical protein
MTKASGRFLVTGGGEDPYDALAGSLRLTHASGTQRFEGELAGDGAVHWLMLYRPDKSARFVGLQEFRGSLDGRTGSFVATADGSHDGTGSAIRFEIIDGSGGDGLAGITGRGTLTASGPTGRYELDYELPD